LLTSWAYAKIKKVLFFSLISKATAQSNSLTGNIIRYQAPSELVRGFVRVAFLGAGITTLFVFIWGGFKFILSGGDEEKREGAKRTVISGLIGLIIVALTPLVINLLITFLGIQVDFSILNIPIP
jgi:hypothetical protein